MTSVNVTASQGITLSVGDGASPETFTEIAGIQDMPAISTAKSVKDRTDLGDANRDYGLGIGEPPSFSLTLFWDQSQTTYSTITTAHSNETEDNYQITCPDSPATVYEFKALLTGYSTPYAGVDGDLMWDINFQLIENDQGEIVTKDPS